MNDLPDIDIDFPDRDKALENVKHIKASKIEDGLSPHVGVYFQDIPTDGKRATVDFKDAEDRGYFKVDFLNNSVYEGVQSNEHLDELVRTEPNWKLLQDPAVVAKLPHIGSYYNIIDVIKPASIYDLAVIIALIRPAKKHLINKPREEIEKEIWSKPKTGYFFKKSHSIAYATTIAVAMNLYENI